MTVLSSQLRDSQADFGQRGKRGARGAKRFPPPNHHHRRYAAAGQPPPPLSWQSLAGKQPSAGPDQKRLAMTSSSGSGWGGGGGRRRSGLGKGARLGTGPNNSPAPERGAPPPPAVLPVSPLWCKRPWITWRRRRESPRETERFSRPRKGVSFARFLGKPLPKVGLGERGVLSSGESPAPRLGAAGRGGGRSGG